MAEVFQESKCIVWESKALKSTQISSHSGLFQPSSTEVFHLKISYIPSGCEKIDLLLSTYQKSHKAHILPENPPKNTTWCSQSLPHTFYWIGLMAKSISNDALLSEQPWYHY